MELEFISDDEEMGDGVRLEDDVDDEGFFWFDCIKICISFGGIVVFFYLFIIVVIFVF